MSAAPGLGGTGGAAAPGSTAGGWTGGQYSIYRIALGATVGWTLAAAYLAPGGAGRGEPAGLLAEALAPVPDWALAAVGLTASLLLAAGALDHLAALLALAAVVPAQVQAAAPWVLPAPLAVPLLLHVCTPRAPYLSWAARGRIDPAGGWTMPLGVHAAAWAALVVAYLAHGSWVLGVWPRVGLAPEPASAPLGPGAPLLVVAWLEVAFAPLLLPRATRALVWTAMLAAQLVVAVLAPAAAVPVAVLLLHLLAFRPAWVPAGCDGGWVLYDGTCGLCHRATRWLLAEDRSGTLRFAPLGGGAAQRLVPEPRRRELPDSIVLRLPDGRLLTRGAALVALGRHLGGLWGALARPAALLPRRALDLGYDLVARTRYRVFGRRTEACPLLPPHLRERFDLS